MSYTPPHYKQAPYSYQLSAWLTALASIFQLLDSIDSAFQPAFVSFGPLTGVTLSCVSLLFSTPLLEFVVGRLGKPGLDFLL